MPMQPVLLPTELIREIIEHVPTDGLSELCLVNSAVRAWVRPMLYRIIFLATKQQFASYARSCACTGGGEHTRTLSLSFSESLPPRELDDLLQSLPQLFSIRIPAAVMCNVTQGHSASRLCLSGQFDPGKWQWQRGTTDVAPHARVTHLFIEDPYCSTTLALQHSQRLFPNLTHLGFATRPVGGAVLAGYVRMWLAAASTLQRLTVFLVCCDARDILRWFPEVWSALQAVQDARIHAYAVDATTHTHVSQKVRSGVQTARLTGAALGHDAVCGRRDLWMLGTSTVENADP